VSLPHTGQCRLWVSAHVLACVIYLAWHRMEMGVVATPQVSPATHTPAAG
jgi:hypothetical protein